MFSISVSFRLYPIKFGDDYVITKPEFLKTSPGKVAECCFIYACLFLSIAGILNPPQRICTSLNHLQRHWLPDLLRAHSRTIFSPFLAKMSNSKDLNIMEFAAYKQYKEDTNYIAAWLAITSQQYGYKIATVGQDDGATGTEGAGNRISSDKAEKERDERNKRATAITPDTLFSRSSTFYVQSKDLVSMAEAIIQSRDVEVPEVVCDILKRAIKHRAGWNLALAAMGFDGGSELKGILEKLHNLLYPAPRRALVEDSSPLRQEKGSIGASGIISDMDSLSFQSLNQQPPTFPQRPVVQPVIFDRGDDEIENEFFLAISLFFWDLMARRKFLNQLWIKYPDKYEASIPAVVTDTLIGQVRAFEREFQDTMVWPFKYPKEDYPTSTLPALFCCWHEQDDPEVQDMVRDVLLSKEVTDPLDRSKALRADSDLALLPEYTACQWFSAKTKHTSGLDMLDVGITTFERDARFHPQMVSALKLLQSGRFALAASCSSFGQDELTKGIFEFHKTGYAPIWVLFGLAVQSDAIKLTKEQSVKRTKLGVSHTPTIVRDLQDTVASISKAIVESGKARNPFPRSEAEKMCYKDLDNLQERLREWVTEDNVGNWTRGLSRCDCTYVERVKKQDNWYMEETPLRAGVLKYMASMQMNHIGQRIEENNRYIFIMAHLYSACRLNNAAIPTWPDLELVIHRQGADHVYGGQAPSSLNDSFQKLLQTCSYPAMSYEAFGKIRGDDAAKAGGDAKQLRRLKNLSPFLEHRFYTQTFATNESTDTPNADLFATLQAPDAPRRLAGLALFRQDQTAEYFAAWKKDWSTHKQGTGSRTWLGKMICLENWMRVDSLNTNFDLLALHSVCADIWAVTLEKLKSSPTYTLPTFIDLENDPLALQALALDILGRSSVGDTASLGILADVIGEFVLEPHTPSKQHTRKIWNGDRGLAGALLQGAKRGLEYPVCYLANDRGLVPGFYRGWIKSRLAKGLVPGAVKAWVDGEQQEGNGIDGFKKWGLKHDW